MTRPALVANILDVDTALAQLAAADLSAAWAYVQAHSEYRCVAMLVPGPQGLVDFIDSQGWNTIEEAQAGCARLDAMLGLNTTVPTEVTFTRADLPTVSSGIFGSAILQEVLDPESIVHWSNGPDVVLNDDSYGLPTAQQLLELITAFHASGAWAPNTNDCDDYARAFMGWLSAQGLGNVAIAEVGFRAYEDGAMTVNHVACIGVDTDRNVWWLDPWVSLMYPFADSYMDYQADQVVLFSLVA